MELNQLASLEFSSIMNDSQEAISDNIKVTLIFFIPFHSGYG